MFEFCLALTLHFGLGSGWNQTNPCVRVTDDRWTVGAFLNSENNISFYGSFTAHSGLFFLEGGAATGYSGAPVVPFLRAGVQINPNTRFFIAPGYETTQNRVGVVIGTEITFR